MLCDIFGLLLKEHFYVRLLWIPFGQLLDKIGYFLFQHLVTLVCEREGLLVRLKIFILQFFFERLTTTTPTLEDVRFCMIEGIVTFFPFQSRLLLR